MALVFINRAGTYPTSCASFLEMFFFLFSILGFAVFVSVLGGVDVLVFVSVSDDNVLLTSPTLTRIQEHSKRL